MSKFLTFAEAATQIGVHVKTLQKHARQGKLETVDTPLWKAHFRERVDPISRLSGY
jgi:predicted site-specific integrase-resolvase